MRSEQGELLDRGSQGLTNGKRCETLEHYTAQLGVCSNTDRGRAPPAKGLAPGFPAQIRVSKQLCIGTRPMRVHSFGPLLVSRSLEVIGLSTASRTPASLRINRGWDDLLGPKRGARGVTTPNRRPYRTMGTLPRAYLT